MNASLAAPPVAAPPSLRCTILYEDFACGTRAKHFAEQLAAALGIPSAAPALWRWELLELPPLAGEALNDATASDFLILSLRGDHFFSHAQKAWIEAWLAAAGSRKPSLVALFAPAHSVAPTVGAAREFLRGEAAGAGVDFFACCQVRPLGGGEPTVMRFERIAHERPLRQRFAHPHGARETRQAARTRVRERVCGAAATSGRARPASRGRRDCRASW